MSDDTWKEIADHFADLHARAEARADKAEANEREAAAQWKRLLENYASAEARAEAAEKREAALREALEEIEDLAFVKLIDAYSIARAALEAGP